MRRDAKSAKEPVRSVPSASASAPRSASAKLAASKLAASKLGVSKLNGTKLSGTKLSAAKLAAANLNGSKLSGSKLVGAKLVNGGKANGAEKLAGSAKLSPTAVPVNGGSVNGGVAHGGVSSGPKLAAKVVPAVAAKLGAPSKIPAPAPVAVAAFIEFKVADKVVYPAHGVGVIDSIEIRKVGGTEQKFYRILFPEAGMKIMVSVSQVANVGLRKVVDHKTVDEVYGILRDRNVAVDTQTWNRRFRDYSQKIKTGSVLEIAKVIRDLSALKSDKELSFGERRMLDTAQGLLVKEISIAKAKSEDVIRAELQSICSVHAI